MPKFVVLPAGSEFAVWWPCVIRQPVDSNGDEPQFEARTLHVKFRALDEEAFRAALNVGPLAVLKAAALDWRAADEAGAPVPFARFGEVAAVPYVREGLFAAYLKFLTGHAEKN